MKISSNSNDGTVEVLGNPLRCLVCQHDRFDKGKAQLNTAAASFFNLDWANRSAVYLACRNCGHLHWFRPK